MPDDMTGRAQVSRGTSAAKSRPAEARPAAGSLSDPARLEAVRRTGLLAEDPPAEIRRVLRLALLGLEAHGAAFLLLSGEGFHCRAAEGLPEAWTAAGPWPFDWPFLVETVFEGPVAVGRAGLVGAKLTALPGSPFRAYAGAPIQDAQGKRVGLLGVWGRAPRAWSQEDTDLLRELAGAVEDVLARRQEARDRTQALNASAERLRDAVEGGCDLMYEWDLRNGELRVVGSFNRLLGYAPGELSLTYEAWVKVLHPEDRERVEARVKRHLEDGAPFFEEYRVLCKDGSVRHWSDRGRALRDPQGNATVWLGLVNDITERRSADEALARSREERDVILGTVASPVLARDPAGRIVFANPAAARLLGFDSPESLMAAPRAALADRFDLADAQGRPLYREEFPGDGALRGLSRQGEVLRVTERATGRVFWAAVNSTPVPDAQGKVRLAITALHDITALKEAEGELARGRDELDAILRTMDSACTAQDLSGKLVFANRAAAVRLGFETPEALLAAGARAIVDRYDIIDASGAPFPVERFPGRRALKGEAVTGEVMGYRVRATGEVMWSLVNGTPVRDAQGMVRMAVNVFHDITAAKRAEEALVASRRRLAMVFENVSDMIVLLAAEPDGGFRIVMANPAYLARCRFPRERLLGARISDLWPEAEAERISGPIRRVAATRRPEVVEVASGGLDPAVLVESLLSPILDEEGRCTHILSVGKDVADRKRAEETNARHLRFLERTDAVARAAETALDSEKVLPTVLAQVLKEMACSRVLLVHPADVDALDYRIPFSAALDGEEPGEIRFPGASPFREVIRQVLEADGPKPVGGLELPDPRFWSEVFGAASLLAMAVRPRAGRPWLFALLRPAGAPAWTAEDQAVFRDIATRITAALGNMLLYRDLRRSEEKYRTLFERSLDGVFRCAPDGTVMDANPALVELLGCASRAELVGEVERQLLPAGAPEGAQGGREPFIVELRRRDGGKVWAEVIAQAIRRSDGELVCFEGMVRNIDDRKRTEAALRESEEVLRQAQKMEAVGRLAGGVAHDFNNLLTAINGFGDLLLMQVPKDDPRRMHVEEIRKAGERAAGLTSQLLAFSRKQVLAPKALDLNAVVAGMEPMLRRLIGENIDFSVAAAPDLPQVLADPNQAEQIVMNLALNARDAMPTGGRLRVETSARRLGAERGARLLDAKEGDYVMLTVTDTGMGMDEETKSRLFEPFFTTKGKDKGTGLGLSMVYGAVKQGNGTIEVETRRGHGTVFRVLLPAAGRDAGTPAPGRPTGRIPAASRGTETILLVEDEDAVRRLVRDVLNFNGYRVLEASGGERALEVAGAHEGTIHLLLTDVVMGGMSGRELAERLRVLRPDTRILYMSGYTEDAIIRHGVQSSQTAFIGKPFTPVALAAKVREVLSGHAVTADRGPSAALPSSA